MAKRTKFYGPDGSPIDTAADEGEPAPSRSEKKRQADQLTQLGVQLTELNAKALAALSLDDELQEAVDTCRRLKRGNARARQGRLIGKLLRQRDTDGLAKDLARLSKGG